VDRATAQPSPRIDFEYANSPAERHCGEALKRAGQGAAMIVGGADRAPVNLL